MTRLTHSMKSDYLSSTGPVAPPPDVGNR